MRLLSQALLLVTCALLAATCSPAKLMAAQGDNFVVWNWGSPDDLDANKLPHISPTDRIGDAGEDNGVKFRSSKAGIYQVSLTLPAFDFDADNYGAINHPFYVTIHFKDVSDKPTTVYAGKGGCGFYGAGYIGTFGGGNDGQWKDETLIIPRSMLRTPDGKTFELKFAETKSAFPIASMTLFSADSKLPGLKEKIAAAEKLRADRHAAKLKQLLPQFKNLGLPDPGPCPEYTPAEKERGFRVFFPPVSRQLFENSQPQQGELTDKLELYACPGQTVPVVIAVRSLKDMSQAKVSFSDLAQSGKPALTASKATLYWAVYSEQRIGSSWGKDYRVCPEQLMAGVSHEVKTDRLGIAYVALALPKDTAAGVYEGTVTVAADGGKSARVPIKLTVYPFKLEHPEHSTHGQFYYSEGCDLNPFEVRDMAEHGMDTVVAGVGAAAGKDGQPNAAPAHRALKLLKSQGYRAPIIDNMGGLVGLTKDEANRPKFDAVIAATLQAGKEEGFAEMGFFPVDEPHTPELIAKAKLACEWIKDVAGANTYITSNPNAVKVLNPILNYVCYNLSYLKDEATIKSMQPHQKLMFYCPSIDVNPERNRFVPGFYMAKINAFCSQYFAYMEFADDPFCDLDGPNRDWNVVYPSMDSVMHDSTLEWESMREGVYDYEYAYTLQSLAERARKAGKTAEADKAMKVLEEVLSAVDVDGNKAGGPAIGIEADTRLKDQKLDPKQVAQAKALAAASWYEQSRRKLAGAIIELKKALGE